MLTLVSNFFFLSGNNITLAYGSDVPLKSLAGMSCASKTPTVRVLLLKTVIQGGVDTPFVWKKSKQLKN